MAIRRVESNPRATPYSRYRKSDTLFVDGERPYLDIPVIEEWASSTGDTYHTVTQVEVGRLDIIAYEYYNTVSLWWIVAEANNILNPMELVAGQTIRIPDISSLFVRDAILS